MLRSAGRRDGMDGKPPKRDKSTLWYAGIAGATFLLHITAWNSKEFCDWYIACVFPVWVGSYGRITGLLPFSLGEILIVLGGILALAAALSGMIWLTGRISGRHGESWKNFDTFCRTYYRFSAWVLLGVFLLMTLNCYILYHGSELSEICFDIEEKEYSLEELAQLREFIVGQCNALCCQIPRDRDGNVLYGGDMATEAKTAMKSLGETYSGLKGFYPDPKPLLCSDFLSQQYIAGCFFPFSMEANYNNVMYVMNMPSTLCHELAHLKGYIREDEANFIGYLACVRSEDICFRYSGYLSVLQYVDGDFHRALEYAGDGGFAETKILPQVYADNIFLEPEEWRRIEERLPLDTDAVDAVSNSITDMSLKLNGVQDGIACYGEVTELLLQYYEGQGLFESGR